MTHLSDYSFLHRGVGLIYVYIWFIHRIRLTQGFDCLYPSKFRRGELKSIVTLLVLFMIPFQLYYDIASTRVKYDEGMVSILGHIVTKPDILWTKADRNLITPTDYSLCVGFSLQIGTLLLLQCFWKYLAKLVAGARFMSSKEFKFYIIMTLVNIILFPIIQFNFSRDFYDSTYKEVMPQFVYGIELFIISILGGVSHFRFKRLLGKSKDKDDGQFITHKMRYFQDLNLLLSVALFLFASCFIILCTDALTGQKRINKNKFLSDFFICNVNILSVVIWTTVILIFHPKKKFEEPHKSYLSTNNTYTGSVLSSIAEDEEHKGLNSSTSNSNK
ncbi:hypothetical protein BD408DRAFT_390628 [Parasitella parasitica]|nr:hypothetical protein BD408DRAFT_390628 [Parasitella parasitica]